MRRLIGLVLGLFLCGGLFVSRVSADTVNVFGTGVDASNNALAVGMPDLHYNLSTNPAGTGPVPISNGWSFGVANTATSAWIGPTACGGCSFPVGDYVYSEAFSLAGLDPSTVQISGQWASDNSATMFLNGGNTGNTLGCCSFGAFTPFSITSGFGPGVNLLQFVVNNSGGPTGVQAQLSGTGTPISAAVPEPSTLQVLLLGLSALALIARKS